MDRNIDRVRISGTKLWGCFNENETTKAGDIPNEVSKCLEEKGTN